MGRVGIKSVALLTLFVIQVTTGVNTVTGSSSEQLDSDSWERDDSWDNDSYEDEREDGGHRAMTPEGRRRNCLFIVDENRIE